MFLPAYSPELKVGRMGMEKGRAVQSHVHLYSLTHDASLVWKNTPNIMRGTSGAAGRLAHGPPQRLPSAEAAAGGPSLSRPARTPSPLHWSTSVIWP